MNLATRAARRLEREGPIRVGLIGAGKFGSMFLSQVSTTPSVAVTVIADLRRETAIQACTDVAWDHARIARARILDDAAELIASDDVEVVVEATGDPIAGARHAAMSVANGKHVVMVNVEADVLVGPMLARQAADAGVVYSLAYGDQPALTCELVDWARTCGFDVVCAGKGTRYLPEYHASTPETVWDHYGIRAEQAESAGMNARMFNSFLDGTKSSIEMAAIANATGLNSAPDGLQFIPCPTDHLAQVLRPMADGGPLAHRGQVEVVSSLYRDGRPVERDLRWGVFVTFEAPNEYSAACFHQYGLQTDDSGRYASLYRPFHLIGLELNVSILSAVLRGEPTGCPNAFRADVVAVAKADLKAGTVLDGEGGFTVWGRLMPARESLRDACLPIGLAHHATLRRDVRRGEVIRRSDVDIETDATVLELRQSMEIASTSLEPLGGE